MASLMLETGVWSTTLAEDAIDHPEVAEDEAAAVKNVAAVEVVEIKDNAEEAVDHHQGEEDVEARSRKREIS